LALAVLCLAGRFSRAEAQMCGTDFEGPYRQELTFTYPFDGVISTYGEPCRVLCNRAIPGVFTYTPRTVLRWSITSTLTDAAFTAQLFNSGQGARVVANAPGNGTALMIDTGLNQSTLPGSALPNSIGGCEPYDEDVSGPPFYVQVGALAMSATGPAPSGSVTITFYPEYEDDSANFTLTKQTTGGDGTFAFTGQQPGRLVAPGSTVPALLTTSIATIGGTGTGQFLNDSVVGLGSSTETFAGGYTYGNYRNVMRLRAGTYSLIEEPAAGFRIRSFTCTGADSYSFTPTTRLLSVTVSARASVACISVSEPDTSSITLTTPAIGGDTTFAFTSTVAGSTAFDIVSSGGTGTVKLDNVANGTYTITESALAGWTLTALACTGGTTSVDLAARTASITVAAGNTIICTFTNTKHATISITQAAINGNATFGFTSSNTGLAAFNLTTSGGTATLANASVLPGSYVITQVALAGWSLTALTCDNGVVNLAARTATLTVSAGESYACTFTSTQQTGILVISQSTRGGDGTFAFTSSDTAAIANFSLTTVSGAASRSFGTVTAGTHTLTAGATAGFDLGSITCSGGTTAINLAAGTATITVGGGVTVSCTFASARRGSISITKTTSGGSATFPFTSNNAAIPAFSLATSSGPATRSFTDLVPGSYTITEGAVAGWSLASLTCTGGTTSINLAGRAVTLTLAAGGAISCTFAGSLQTGSITLVARTTGGDGTVAFTSNEPELTTSLVTSGGVAQKIANKVPGTYTITQSSITGGQFKTVACTGGTTKTDQTSKSATITLAINDNVTCTFTSLAGEEVVRQTQRVISRFIGQRASSLLSASSGDRGMARLGGGVIAGVGGGFGFGPVNVGGHIDGSGVGRLSFSTSLSQMQRQRASETSTHARSGSAGRDTSDAGRTDGALLPEGAPAEGLGSRGAPTSAYEQTQRSVQGTKPLVLDLAMLNRLGMSTGGAAPASATGPQPKFDIWLDGQVTRFRDGTSAATRRGDLAVVSVGADYLVRPALLIGAMAQFDWATDIEDLGAQVKGRGWMAGPYADLKLSPNLYVHSRALWGRSSNEINPLGTYTDTFTTSRALYRAGLTGNWIFDQWRLTPSVSLAHFREDQHAYTDTLGNSIAASTITLNRMTFGPEIGYRYQDVSGWSVEPSIALYGQRDFAKSGTGAMEGEVAGGPNFRVGLRGGVAVVLTGGIVIRATGQYDGLGEKDFRALTGKLDLRVPLQ
jgi:hypothetical protein